MPPASWEAEARDPSRARDPGRARERPSAGRSRGTEKNFLGASVRYCLNDCVCVCVCVWTCCLPSIFSFTVKSSQNVCRVCVFWLFKVSTEAGRCHEVSVGRGRSAPADLPARTLTGSSVGSARPCGRVGAAGPPSSPLTYHVTLTPE